MKRVSTDKFYEAVFVKYCEWMRDMYLENPNRKTIHPYEYVHKVIELVREEDRKSYKQISKDKIF
jgi:hypothetical protein